MSQIVIFITSLVILFIVGGGAVYLYDYKDKPTPIPTSMQTTAPTSMQTPIPTHKSTPMPTSFVGFYPNQASPFPIGFNCPPGMSCN